MSNRVVNQPVDHSPCWEFSSHKKVALILSALVAIAALAALLTGTLGIYNISFFKDIAVHVSQGLAIVGGGVLVTALITTIVCLASCKESPDENKPKTEKPSPPLKFPKPKVPHPVQPAQSRNPKKSKTRQPITHLPAESTEELPPPLTPPVNPAPPSKPPDPQPEVKPMPSEILPIVPESIWKPLAILHKKRQQNSFKPLQFLLLEELENLIPIPTTIQGSFRPAQSSFLKHMQETYRGLLKGEVNLVVEYREKTLRGDGNPPINMISAARQFITKRLEAFNELLKARQASAFAIKINTFFDQFAEEETELNPNYQLRSLTNTFTRNLREDVLTLIQTEASALSHLDAIKNYAEQEIATFNLTMKSCIQELQMNVLFFEIDITTLRPLLRLASLWLRMKDIYAFEGNIDEKIALFEQLCTDFPETEDEIWMNNPAIKNLIVQSFYESGKGFFSQHKFWLNNPDDVEKKVKVESLVQEIARKLEVPPPDIEIQMETDDDHAEAVRQQKLLDAGRPPPPPIPQDILQMFQNGQITQDQLNAMGFVT